MQHGRGKLVSQRTVRELRRRGSAEAPGCERERLCVRRTPGEDGSGAASRAILPVIHLLMVAVGTHMFWPTCGPKRARRRAAEQLLAERAGRLRSRQAPSPYAPGRSAPCGS